MGFDFESSEDMNLIVCKLKKCYKKHVNLMITFIHYISTLNLDHAWNYTEVIRIASEIFEARKD